jgi:hypothetical protein
MDIGITKNMGDFIMWFKSIPNDEKDFASALMIANLSDEKLERIKRLTQENASVLINSLKSSPC